MLLPRVSLSVFSGARVNGTWVGESGINALVARHFGVPIAVGGVDASSRSDVLDLTRTIRARIGALGRDSVDSNRGALGKLLGLIEPLLRE